MPAPSLTLTLAPTPHRGASRRSPMRSCVGLLLLSAAALLVTALPAQAADTEVLVVEPAQDRLDTARQLIRQERWRDAIAALQRLDATDSADWHNLMGYSHRKARAPDLAAAERHYDAALRIDPQHRGALSYSGELYLSKGEPARAEARLAQLDKACGSGCPEQLALRQALDAFKAGKPLPAKKPGW
jgi:Flp pilus assembly protein TadD